MQLYIGDNIKRLRRQKGITQETLAERMHVSTAAVSNWERNEAIPDISMVLPLASYFGVSTDELLGLDAAKTEERIQAIMDERNRLCALGKAREAFDLIAAAYEEFPDDWRIVEEYMWKLYYDPNREEPHGNEVHKDAVFSEGGRIHGEIWAMEKGHGPQSAYWPRLSTQEMEGPEHTKAVMMRMGDLKYVYRLYEKDELYDLKKDPKELKNVIEVPEYQEAIVKMKMRMLQFMVETGDIVPNRKDIR